MAEDETAAINTSTDETIRLNTDENQQNYGSDTKPDEFAESDNGTLCSLLKAVRKSPYSALVVVAFAIFIDRMTASALMIILPNILRKMAEFNGNPNGTLRPGANFPENSIESSKIPNTTEDLSRNYLDSEFRIMGILTTAYTLSQIFGQFVCGVLTFKFGHTCPLMIGLVMSAGSIVLCIVATSWWMFIFTFAALGLSTAFTNVAGNSLLAAIFKTKRRRAFAFTVVINLKSLGYMTGSSAGPYFYQWVGRQAPFIFFLSLMVLDCIMRLLLLPDKAKAPKTSSEESAVSTSSSEDSDLNNVSSDKSKLIKSEVGNSTFEKSELTNKTSETCEMPTEKSEDLADSTSENSDKLTSEKADGDSEKKADTSIFRYLKYTKTILTTPTVFTFLFFNCIGSFGFSMYNTCEPLWAIRTLKAEDWQLGTVRTVALINNFVAVATFGYLVSKFSQCRWIFLMTQSLLVGSVFILFTFATNIWETFGQEITLHIAYALFNTTFYQWIPDIADIVLDSKYEIILAMDIAIKNIGVVLGSAVSGIVLVPILGFNAVFLGYGATQMVYSFSALCLRHLSK